MESVWFEMMAASLAIFIVEFRIRWYAKTFYLCIRVLEFLLFWRLFSIVVSPPSIESSELFKCWCCHGYTWSPPIRIHLYIYTLIHNSRMTFQWHYLFMTHIITYIYAHTYVYTYNKKRGRERKEEKGKLKKMCMYTFVFIYIRMTHSCLYGPSIHLYIYFFFVRFVSEWS